MSTSAREQIDDALRWYCRGIDRLDGGAVARAFHAGAILVDYRPQPLTIEAFIAGVVPSLAARFTATQHRISNTLAAFAEDGRSALVETYVLAYHVESAAVAGTAVDQLHTFDGRYIDRFTEVDGVWRIAERTLRCDWSKIEPIDERMRSTWPQSGRAGSPDPLDG